MHIHVYVTYTMGVGMCVENRWQIFLWPATNKKKFATPSFIALEIKWRIKFKIALHLVT